MKTEILTVLKEAPGFVSGQELCGRLGVSRTAVWKVIKQLEEEGYQIEAVRNKGYRLAEAADVITEAEIGSRLRSKWMGRHLVYFPETYSTKIKAKRLGEEGRRREPWWWRSARRRVRGAEGVPGPRRREPAST